MEKVALICVTYNSKHLYKTLLSLYKHTKFDGEWKLFLFDNKPDERKLLYDRIARWKLPNTEIIKSDKNVFWTGGLNYCLSLTKDYDYIVFLNDDIQVYEGWLENHIEVLRNNPEIGAVGPLNSCEMNWQYINRVAETFKVVDAVSNTDLTEVNAQLKQLNKPHMLIKGMLAFFCTAFPRKVFDDHGYIDEDFGDLLCGDDDDFCFRIQHYGYKLAVLLNTYVIHEGGVSTQAMSKEKLETYNKRKITASKLLAEKRQAYLK